MIASDFDNRSTEMNFTRARYPHNAAILNSSMTDLCRHVTIWEVLVSVPRPFYNDDALTESIL